MSQSPPYGWQPGRTTTAFPQAGPGAAGKNANPMQVPNYTSGSDPIKASPAGAAPAPSQGAPSSIMQPQYADPASAYTFPTVNGADIRQPGALEQAWGQQGGQYAQPTMSHGVDANILSNYGDGSRLPQDPGLGTYYGDAETRANNALKSQGAATGTYGSSYGAQQQANMYSGMEADRAKNEAQYNLARSADQRNWATALSGIAGSADSADLNKLNSGFNTAGGVENAQNNRFQTNFGDSMQLGDALSGIMTHANDQANHDYWHALDASTGLSTAMGANGVSDATYNGQQSRQDMNDTINMGANGFKAGSAIYQGFNQPQPASPGYYQTGPSTDTYNMPTMQM